MKRFQQPYDELKVVSGMQTYLREALGVPESQDRPIGGDDVTSFSAP